MTKIKDLYGAPKGAPLQNLVQPDFFSDLLVALHLPNAFNIDRSNSRRRGCRRLNLITYDYGTLIVLWPPRLGEVMFD